MTRTEQRKVEAFLLGAVMADRRERAGVEEREAAEQGRREREAAQRARNGGVAHLSVLGPITTKPGAEGISAATFSLMAKGAAAWKPKAALLLVDSSGGDAAAGMGIIGSIREIQASGVRVIADVKRADSMAGLIVAACDYAVLRPAGRVIVHALSGGDEGMRDAFTRSAREILIDRTMLPQSVIDGMTDGSAGADFTFQGYEAVQAGLVDEVGEPDRADQIARHLAACGWWTSCGADSYRRQTLAQRRAATEARR